MPRGVPKAGYRNRKQKVSVIDLAMKAKNVIAFEETRETDDQIREKLSDRFSVLSELTDNAVQGDIRSLIVSGPPGLGKSFTVEQALKKWDPEQLNHTIIKGYVKATGLYRTLYQFRQKNKVIVFDDADSIFFDDTALNMLKTVCDTTERRTVSYLADYNMVDGDSADLIPRSFDFDGTIVFITNMDFDRLIDGGSKIAPHLEAMISRSHYLDLEMKSRRDYIIRIEQVVDQGLLSSRGLSDREVKDTMDFIYKNQSNLRELSLRMAIKIGDLRMKKPNWEKVCRMTLLRAR